MAGLNEAAASESTPALGAQLLAITHLRWRIFANSLRRRGGKAELAGRLLLFPILASLALGPALAVGAGAWYLLQTGRPTLLSLLFWAAFAVAQLVNINLGSPGSTFDPAELLRFPLSLARYTLVRLCFGLLSPGNLVATLMSATIFAGVCVADPPLWPLALLATASFALANILFTRMAFAWVDRWLSTRRAREIFTGLIFIGSLLLQYFNLNYNPALRHGRHAHHASAFSPEALQLLQHITRWLQWLPPELAGTAIRTAATHATAPSVLRSTAILLYAALFLAVFMLRMRTEYRGENLSDTANAVRPVAVARQPAYTTGALQPIARTGAPRRQLIPSSLAPLLTKELLLLRRNVGLLYGVVAPMVMVFLFAGRVSMHGGSQWVLYLAVGYALLGVAPLSFNSLGLDGTGAQLYLMAPVPIREIFLAKNLLNLMLALTEVIAIVIIVSLIAARPDPLAILFVMLWAVGALLFGTSVGNLRSIAAPKRVQPGRSMQRSQSQLSVWMSFGILLGCALLGTAFQFVAIYLHQPWLALVLVAAFAALAIFAYSKALQHVGPYLLQHRETLLEELSRKT